MAVFYYPDGKGGRKRIPLDSDIPTMSESIKGGAKVGEGLFVDEDEKLNAPFSAQIPNLINRIAQGETNIGNLYMQLIPFVNPLEANLLIYEDFTKCRAVDLFKVKVLETVGGPDDVYVESLNGILVGHWYILSDGTHSRLLRVRAIATNDGLCDVMFEEPINLTFNLSKTYLYRTTAKVSENTLLDSADVKEKVFSFGETWNGVSASTSKTITLKTTQQKANNFELSGNYGFTADGFFTIV